MLRYVVFILGFLILGFQLSAQSSAEQELQATKSLLAMDPGQMKARIETMTGEEASRVLSQVRFLVRERNPDVDKIYFLMEHLEGVRAADLAQRRLNNLLLVIGLTLTLFVGYLGFINFDQRRALRRMEQVLADRPSTSERPGGSVYRGES